MLTTNKLLIPTQLTTYIYVVHLVISIYIPLVYLSYYFITIIICINGTISLVTLIVLNVITNKLWVS